MADASVLTYVALVDCDFVARHGIKSISGCLQETLFNLRDGILKEKLSAGVSLVEAAGKRGDSKPGGLSSVDFALLQTCVANSGACMVTDDSELAFEARSAKVKVFSTPALVEYLVKNRLEEKRVALEFLQKLLPLYYRKGKVASVIERISSY